MSAESEAVAFIKGWIECTIIVVLIHKGEGKIPDEEAVRLKYKEMYERWKGNRIGTGLATWPDLKILFESVTNWANEEINGKN